MDNRRVHTEENHDEGLSEDEEFYKKQLEFYADSDEDEEDYDDDEAVDHNNYKGIYIDEDPGTKFQDPETGAHFDYQEIYDKLLEVETNIGRSQERDQKTIQK